MKKKKKSRIPRREAALSLSLDPSIYVQHNDLRACLKNSTCTAMKVPSSPVMSKKIETRDENLTYQCLVLFQLSHHVLFFHLPNAANGNVRNVNYFFSCIEKGPIKV